MLQADSRNRRELEPGSVVAAAQVLQRRLDAFGARDAAVQQERGARLVVEASGVTALGRLEALLLQVGEVDFRITDMGNRFRDAIPAIDRALAKAGAKVQPVPGSGAARTVEQLFGADSNTLTRGKGKTAAPSASGLSPILHGGELPGEFLVPEEQAPMAESLLARPEVQRLMPRWRGIALKWARDVTTRGGRSYRALYAVEDRPILTGKELERAVAAREPLTREAVVNFTLSRRGGRLFEQETRRHINDYLAIVLDGHVQGQPPIIKSPIGRRGQIELGPRPLADAEDLATILTAGSLPTPLVLMEETVLGPSRPASGVIDLWVGAVTVIAWGLMLLALARRARKQVSSRRQDSP
ncbi:MAG TPA: hypothetical protein VM736_04785 [Gemmatimonadales bacterium]|nr:hypothetical protein [Gemmatimonadales bacterium]